MKCTAESKFTSLVFAAFFLAASASASFEPLPLGGRAAGMGEAYTAIVDDVYALYYNPAGVLQISRPEIGTYYSRLFVGLTDNSSLSRSFIGYAQPLGENGNKGGIGAHYAALELPGLYKEETFALTYGREFRRTLNLGATLKMMRKVIGSDEYTENAIDPVSGDPTGSPDGLLAGGHSKSGVSMDLGMQYRLNRAYALGAAIRNINQPNLALGSASDKVPAVYAIALARKLRMGSFDVEIMDWKGTENNLRLMVGGERWMDNGFGVRAGGGIGSNNYSTLSFGGSYKMESIQLDYAMIYPLQGVAGTLGTQQISLTIRLGKAPIDPLEKQLMEEKEERVKAETESRYAKAERDRLKAQLHALTQEKSRAEKEKEQKAAQQALEEAQQQKTRQEQKATKTQDNVLMNSYTESLTDYNAKVRSGIGLSEKRSLLEKILAKFKDSGVDTSIVSRELKSLIAEESKMKKDFDQSMGFYRRLVQQGASAEDRRGMLNRIIQKYKGTGIDVKDAEAEMNSLQ